MNGLRQTFDLQNNFFARLLPRVDPSHVLVVLWSLQLEDASAQAAVRLLMLCMGVRA